jgi:hypothetical protein
MEPLTDMPTSAVGPHSRFYSDMAIQLLQFSATCQFIILHYSGRWLVGFEPIAAVGMPLNIPTIVAILRNSAH